MSAKQILADLAGEVRQSFTDTRRVLSFEEYFEMALAAPQRHARNAAQFLLDAIESFGIETVQRPWGNETRFKLFDIPFEAHRDRLVAQEVCQGAIHRLLKNFTREGRINKLILLHGPNGSAKSRIIDCIARALSHYSHTDDGALYRFNWIFPNNKLSKKPLGFEEHQRPQGPVLSFAYLDDEQVDVRLSTTLRDHPLFLLPRDRRAQLLERRTAELDLKDRFVLSDYLLNGDLSPKNRDVYDALLTSYQGDYERVLQHVQVERFFISRRYRRGIATVEPQLHVDASARQITMDQTLENLPSSLRSLTLYEPAGDLVDANRGLIEYNDLLKRPVDAFKYLMATCEKSNVALPNCILYLDVVFLGSSNEKHLSAFKTLPDFSSFKGRIETVRVPYLRSYLLEQQIYDDHLHEMVLSKHVAPHVTEVAALWAVLTRMMPVDGAALPKELQDCVKRLTPLDKAHLYARGQEPRWLPNEKRGQLRARVRDLLEAAQDEVEYEGSSGVSPREMKTMLLNAAQDEQYRCLSPAALLAELERFVRDPTLHEFLMREPVNGYFDSDGFIEQARKWYRDLAEREVRGAMGLVGESEYEQLFRRYVQCLSAMLKGEKILNPITGRDEPPDERFMADMERKFKIEAGSQRTFRERLVREIGAYRVDHPGEDMPYPEVFAKLFEAMHDSFYESQKETVEKRRAQFLVWAAGDHGNLSPSEIQDAQVCMQQLQSRFGYCPACAREAFEFLHRMR